MDASIKLIKKLKLLGMNIDTKLNYINDRFTIIHEQ